MLPRLIYRKVNVIAFIQLFHVSGAAADDLIKCDSPDF